MKKMQSAFTLVELLVVIAIIGILASVIIASLGDAREQGIEAKIKTEVDGIAKRAAINNATTHAYDEVCGSNSVATSTIIMDHIASINNLASGTLTCNSDTTTFAVSVPLNTGHWCVDSTGAKKTIVAALTTAPAELVCP